LAQVLTGTGKSHMYGKNSEIAGKSIRRNRFTKKEMDRSLWKKKKGTRKNFAPTVKLIAGLEPVS